MTALFFALLIVLAVIGLVSIHLALVRRAYGLSTYPDEIHFAHTGDGWRLALHRYRPEEARKGIDPVVLCPGLGTNRFKMDLRQDRSLARDLRRQGFDVFVLELRGAGQSTLVSSEGSRVRWNFDDHVKEDLPAAMEVVLRVTGAQKVNWVGHDMGGMVMYAFLQGHHPLRDRVRSLVTLGAPITFSGQLYLDFYARLIRLFRFLPQAPVGAISRLLAPVGAYVPLTGARLMAHRKNLESRTIAQIMANVNENINMGLLLQFSEWFLDNRFTSADGLTSYEDGMGQITIPVLLIGGTADKVVPPSSIQTVLETLGSQDKDMRLFGRRFGNQEDYGHSDLILGKAAPTEVYPFIVEWVGAKGGAEQTGWDSRWPGQLEEVKAHPVSIHMAEKKALGQSRLKSMLKRRKGEDRPSKIEGRRDSFRRRDSSKERASSRKERKSKG